MLIAIPSSLQESIPVADVFYGIGKPKLSLMTWERGLWQNMAYQAKKAVGRSQAEVDIICFNKHSRKTG